MLWIVRKHAEAIGDLGGVIFLFSHDSLGQIFESVSICELLMVGHLSKQPVAGNHVALDYLPKIVKSVLVDHQFGADGGPLRLLMLLNVDVDQSFPPELPRQRYVVLGARRWTEDEISDLTFVQLQSSSPRRHILELLKGNTPCLESPHLLRLRLSREILILHVFVRNVLPLNSRKQLHVLLMALQIALLAL